MSNENKTHIEANLEVIREYLIGQFKGFEVTDTPDRPLSHTFSATKSSDERYHVKVSWRQLSDDSNTPERTKQCSWASDLPSLLVHENYNLFSSATRLNGNLRRP